MNREKQGRFGVRVVVVAGVLALVAGTAPAGMGQGMGEGHGMAPLLGADPAGPAAPGPILRALRAGLATLDLTDQQKADIKALFESKKPEFQALRDQITTDRAALKAAAEAATPDPATVGNAFLKVKADGLAVKAQFETTRDALKALLTADQWTKLQGFMSGLRHGRRLP